jgi:hypothetical protein
MRQISRILVVAITLASKGRVADAGIFKDSNTRIENDGGGGAGTMALIYSEKADPSIPFCTDYDLIIGLKNGEVLLKRRNATCGRGLEVLRYRPYLILSVIPIGIP